jgi:hypothetical protein
MDDMRRRAQSPAYLGWARLDALLVQGYRARLAASGRRVGGLDEDGFEVFVALEDLA